MRFLISPSVARLKTFILIYFLVFALMEYCVGQNTLSGNLELIVLILSTKYLEKWSQSDFTEVNSDP